MVHAMDTQLIARDCGQNKQTFLSFFLFYFAFAFTERNLSSEGLKSALYTTHMEIGALPLLQVSHRYKENFSFLFNQLVKGLYIYIYIYKRVVRRESEFVCLFQYPCVVVSFFHFASFLFLQYFSAALSLPNFKNLSG